MLHGIDVSSYQPPAPDVSGLAFLFVKVTEATSYVNPEWQSQYADGRSRGLVVGKYHYPSIAADPVAEADYFLAHAYVQPADVLILDWEWHGQAGVTGAMADTYKAVWLAHVKSVHPGNRVILYADRNNWLTVDTTSYCQDGLWIADYTTAAAPRITHSWLFHQYASSPQDEDVASPQFADLAALKAWANPSDPTPTPTPQESVSSFPFTIEGQGGIHFARGACSNVAFFVDNTLTGEAPAKLRVVIWATGQAPYIETVSVSNSGSAEAVVHFPDASLTHTVTVTREDGATFPVHAEAS